MVARGIFQLRNQIRESAAKEAADVAIRRTRKSQSEAIQPDRR